MKNSSKVVEPKTAVGKKKAVRTNGSRSKLAEGARETIGIDLGDTVSRYAILDASGELAWITLSDTKNDRLLCTLCKPRISSA